MAVPHARFQGDGFNVFRDRRRFARQHRLVRFQVVRIDEAGIGRHPVALRHADHIAGHEFGRVQFPFQSVAPRARPCANVAFQALKHGLRFVFLPETKRRVHRDREEDGRGVGPVVQDERNAARRDERDDERTPELVGKNPQARQPADRHDGVRSESFRASFCFVRTQTARRRGKRRKRVLARQ